MKSVAWGILGVARIATERVIPALQQAEHCTLQAIASRSLQRARQAAAEHRIARAFGSYDELLADPEVRKSFLGG